MPIDLDFVELFEVLKVVFYGATAAGGAAIAGYARAHFKDGEKWDWVKFTNLALIGFIFGGAAAGLGWEPVAVKEWLAGMGLMSAVSLLVLKVSQSIVSVFRAKVIPWFKKHF